MTDDVTQTTSGLPQPEGQPGLSRAHNERAGQPADLLSQPGSQLSDTFNGINISISGMADLIRQLIEDNRATRNRQLDENDSDSENDTADSAHSLPKRRRAADEISLAPSDEDIRTLLDPADETIDGRANNDSAQPTDELLKSLEAEYSDSEPVGPKVNEGLANIAKKRWGFSLTAEKLKQDKHQQPENCELPVPKVNLELWAPMSNAQRRADLRLRNVQQALQKAAFALLKTSDKLVGETKDASKTMLAQNIDAIVLLGHAVEDISALRRERIKPTLKAEYVSLCNKDSEGTGASKFLFGDDLPKKIREAKETNAITKKIGASIAEDNRNRNGGASRYNNYYHKRYRKEGKSQHKGKDYFLGKGKKPHHKLKPSKK